MSLLLLLNSFFSTCISHPFTIFIPLLFLSPVLCKMLKLLFVHDPSRGQRPLAFTIFPSLFTVFHWPWMRWQRYHVWRGFSSVTYSQQFDYRPHYQNIRSIRLHRAYDLAKFTVRWTHSFPQNGLYVPSEAVSYLRIAMPLVHSWKYLAWKIAIACYSVHCWVRQWAGVLLQFLAWHVPAL